ETLIKNVFKNNEFIIFPASSVAELVEESKQQNNCVRTYAERYADGNCDIYFMRKIDTPNVSLVTVEVRDNKVVQKRTKNNEKTNKKQDKFLDTWQKKVLERVAV
ncbi:MAG: PcfJ domain-containing protein, partial [Clostridia bacterium]|nr:PcfJ domain-containing protein [Clostridia bacterium]